jgi:hypothetical protein
MGSVTMILAFVEVDPPSAASGSYVHFVEGKLEVDDLMEFVFV